MEELDSFDDTTPIELPVEGAADTGTQDAGHDGSLDTFDSPAMSQEEIQKKMEEMNEEGDGKGDDEKKLEEVSQTDKIDKSESKLGEEQSESEKPEDDKEASDEGADKPSEEGVPSEDEKPKGKTVRVKDGDKALDIAEDATLKVKVKGKNEFVSISELKKNYSGQVAFDEKFAEVNQEKEAVIKREQGYLQEKQVLASHLSKIAEIMDNPEKNPYEALSYLVDMRGGNPVEFNKRVLQYMSSEVERLSEMDEVEQELYWTRQEADLLKNRSTAKADEESRAKTEMERNAQLASLRESQGVTEEQYVQSKRELLDLGYDESQATPEAIVNYAVMQPHYEKAEGLCKPYEEDLSTDDVNALVSRVARTLKENPKITNDDALMISAKMIGLEVETYDDDIKELNEKIPEPIVNKPRQKIADKGEDHLESFDDFDELNY
jgi:hypothetical protein